MSDETKLTREAIAADRQRRTQECGKRLAELLAEYDCDLVAQPQFTQDGRVVAVVQLIAK